MREQDFHHFKNRIGDSWQRREQKQFPVFASLSEERFPRAAEMDQVQPTRRDAVNSALILMLACTSILLALGILMVFSATSAASIRALDIHGSSVPLFSVAIRHLIFAIAGILFALVLSRFEYVALERLSYWFFGLGLLLQFAVIIAGKEVAGNRNWIGIGAVQIQPSEFLKLAMIVWLAHMFALISGRESRDFRSFFPAITGIIFAVGTVILPGDMGTALIMLMIGAGLAWLAGLGAAVFGIGALFATVLAGIFVAIAPSRLARVASYLNNLWNLPDTHAPTQSDFAQFAFGSGGITGLGVGAGKEKWLSLSEAHTDFIFAVIGEEIGFIGTMIVLLLFLALAWSFLQLTLNIPSRFGQLLTAGAGLWICGQAFLNMMVVVGLLPVFGVPLPFISQGGSAIMANLMMIGVVVSAARGVPG
ncbi:putative peptidoglycan glycosyltransferase FtsW [Arcanobacterium hippocoleae]